jgi:hypothetical protein
MVDPRERVVLYPVRHRSEDTMRDDLATVGSRHVLAVAAHDDPETLEGLRRLRPEFPALDILIAPEAADPSWSLAFRSWLSNQRAWRERRWKRKRFLPAPQRRQVVYGYHFAEAGGAVIEGVLAGT